MYHQQAPTGGQTTTGPYGNTVNYEQDADDQIRQPQTQQAILRTECEANRNIIEQLTKGHAAANPADIIPGGTMAAEHNWRVGDLVLLPINDLKARAKGPPVGIVALNGQNHAAFLTSRDMQTAYRLGGPCITEVIFDKPGQPKLKVGIVKGGSFTIFNRSLQHLFKGDIIRWRMPGTWDKLSGRQPNSDYVKTNKLGGKVGMTLKPWIELYDHRVVYEALKHIFYRMFPRAGSYLPLVDVFDQYTNSVRKLPFDDMVAASKLVGMMHAGVSLIEMLQERDIIDINTPEHLTIKSILLRTVPFLRSGQLPDANTWASLSRDYNDVIEGHRTIAEVSNNMRFDEFYETLPMDKRHVKASIENDDISAHKTFSSLDTQVERENRVLWLMCRLGIIKNANMYVSQGVDTGSANEFWVRDFILKYWWNYIPPTEDFAAVRAIYSPASVIGRGKGLATTNQALHSNNIRKQKERFQQSAPDVEQSYYNMFINEEQRHVIGEVLYAAGPMEPVAINRATMMG